MKKYPEYINSDIAWIGNIPSHWKIKHLRSYLRMVSDKGHPNETLLSVTREQGVIVRNVESKEENHNFIPDDLTNYKLVKVGQFAINKMKSWQGSYAVSKFQGIVSPAYYVCELNFPNKDFFSWAIRSKSYIPFFTQYSKGIRVDQWDLSPIALKSIPFIEPPIEEQNSIVGFISDKVAKIDTLISKTEEEINLLNELKQAEVARLVTRGLNPNVQMKDSGITWIGKIPEEWEIKRIAILFSENKNKNTDYEFHRALKFNYGRLIPKNETGDISELKDTYTAYTKIKKNDIAINCLNLNYDFISQRVAIAREDGILTSAYLIMSPRQGVNAEYYNYFFKSMDNKKLFHGMGTGIRLTLSYSELKKQYVIVPPVEEQSAIVAAIEVLNSKVDNLTSQLKKQISCLQELKQRVISDAVTGKIDVRDYNN